MEYIGRITKVFDEKTGVSAKTGNPWHSLSFIFEYFPPESQRFPDAVVLKARDEITINLLKNEEIFKLMNGKSCVKVDWYNRVDEYNGRYYNDPQLHKFEFLPELAGVEKPRVNIPSSPETATEAKNEGKTEAATDSTQTGGAGDPNPEDDDLPF